jgi:hypothetical protein
MRLLLPEILVLNIIFGGMQALERDSFPPISTIVTNMLLLTKVVDPD